MEDSIHLPRSSKEVNKAHKVGVGQQTVTAVRDVCLTGLREFSSLIGAGGGGPLEEFG